MICLSYQLPIELVIRQGHLWSFVRLGVPRFLVGTETTGMAQFLSERLGLWSGERDESEQPMGCSDPAGFAAGGGSFQFASTNCRTLGTFYGKIQDMTNEAIPPEKPKRVKPKRVYSDKYSDHLEPRYWTTWLGLACMVIIAHLPTRLSMAVGILAGHLLYFFGHNRRRITTINIGLCFPELSEPEQKKLIRQTTVDSGIGFVEMCISWFNHTKIKPDMIEIQGDQNLYDAAGEGRGVILVGAHYTTLDLGGLLMAQCRRVGVMYRANKNPLFDLIVRNSRKKFCETVIERSDMRSVIRFIKDGGVMWYAPDQDYGPKQAVFAPFFGIEAATITVIPRLVKVNNSPVLILSHHRKPNNGGYIVSISEPVKDYPTGNDRADATRINALLESEIRKYPEQYMWLHRKFKTRPEGVDRIYPKKR